MNTLLEGCAKSMPIVKRLPFKEGSVAVVAYDHTSNTSRHIVHARTPRIHEPPTSAAFCCNFSSSITDKTSSPTAHATGFPPNVLKYSIIFELSATSFDVITAESGNPFPKGFPSASRKAADRGFTRSNTRVDIRKRHQTEGRCAFRR